MTATRKAKGTEAPPAVIKPATSKPAASKAAVEGRRVTSGTSRKRVAEKEVAVVAEATLETIGGGAGAEGEPVAPKPKAAKRVTKAPAAKVEKPSSPAFTSPAFTSPAFTSEASETRGKLESIAPESAIPESVVPESGMRVLRAGKRREASEAPPADHVSAPAPVNVPPAATVSASVSPVAAPVVAPSQAHVDADVETIVETAVEATPAQVDELTRLLGDAISRTSDAWVHYQVLMTHLGPAHIGSLVARAREVQAQGGLTIENGDGYRTLGGVFFAIAREELGPVTWRELRKEVRKRAVRKPPVPAKPVRFEPEVVMVRRRSAF